MNCRFNMICRFNMNYRFNRNCRSSMNCRFKMICRFRLIWRVRLMINITFIWGAKLMVNIMRNWFNTTDKGSMRMRCNQLRLRYTTLRLTLTKSLRVNNQWWFNETITWEQYHSDDTSCKMRHINSGSSRDSHEWNNRIGVRERTVGNGKYKV